MGQDRGEGAHPGPDLHSDVLFRGFGGLHDLPEDVLVHQEVLPEALAQADPVLREEVPHPRRRGQFAHGL